MPGPGLAVDTQAAECTEWHLGVEDEGSQEARQGSTLTPGLQLGLEALVLLLFSSLLGCQRCHCLRIDRSCGNHLQFASHCYWQELFIHSSSCCLRSCHEPFQVY